MRFNYYSSFNIVILILLSLLTGCVTAPLKEPIFVISENNINKKDVMMAVLDAFRFTCWKVEKLKKNNIYAFCDKGNYSLNVDIKIKKNSFIITYKDSNKMRYDSSSNVIHKKYNIIVDVLKNNISLSLRNIESINNPEYSRKIDELLYSEELIRLAELNRLKKIEELALQKKIKLRNLARSEEYNEYKKIFHSYLNLRHDNNFLKKLASQPHPKKGKFEKTTEFNDRKIKLVKDITKNKDEFIYETSVNEFMYEADSESAYFLYNNILQIQGENLGDLFIVETKLENSKVSVRENAFSAKTVVKEINTSYTGLKLKNTYNRMMDLVSAHDGLISFGGDKNMRIFNRVHIDRELAIKLDRHLNVRIILTTPKDCIDCFYAYNYKHDATREEPYDESIKYKGMRLNMQAIIFYDKHSKAVEFVFYNKPYFNLNDNSL